MGQSWHAQRTSTSTIMFFDRAPSQWDLEKWMSRVDQCLSQRAGKRLIYCVLCAGRADRHLPTNMPATTYRSSRSVRSSNIPSGRVVRLLFSRDLWVAQEADGRIIDDTSTSSHVCLSIVRGDLPVQQETQGSPKYPAKVAASRPPASELGILVLDSRQSQRPANLFPYRRDNGLARLRRFPFATTKGYNAGLDAIFLGTVTKAWGHLRWTIL